jgi:hypothetical protein
VGEIVDHPLQLGVWMHSRQAVAARSEEEMLAVFVEDGQGSASRDARRICKPGEEPSGFYRDIVRHARRYPLEIHRWGLLGEPLCKTCHTEERAT